jgi:multimeric flavodoxin WrbA
VIIGTPVWARTVSHPVRTFIHHYKDHLEKVAFFSTQDGEDPQNTFTDMEALYGKNPISVLSITSKEVKQGNYVEKIERFVDEMRKEI